MEIVTVRPGIYACLTANQGSNAGFIETTQGVVVVDAFDTPAHGCELAAAVESRTRKPAWLLINTHHHFDHVLGNQAFAAPVVAQRGLADELEQAVARELAPQEVADWVAEHPEDRWLADELVVRYPNVTFEERLWIDVPPKQLALQHLGGHTPESIVVDLPEDRVLFAGDLVFEGRVPFLRDAHLRQTIDALRWLERLGARTVVPGHGTIVNMGYVGRLRGYLGELVDAIGELITEGRSLEEILASDRLPRWWTEDRPELARANVARAYEEMVVKPE